MHIHIVQENFTVGDFDGNRQRIEKHLFQQNPSEERLFLFSELALCGYPPMDLLERPHFLDEQNKAFKKLQQSSQRHKSAIAVGHVVKNPHAGQPFLNAVSILKQGEVLHTFYKQLLPTYDIFDEARYFAPGPPTKIWHWQGWRLGLLICEDAWNHQTEPARYKDNPVLDLIQQKIDALLLINASPAEYNKAQTRDHYFSQIARAHQLPIVYVNQVGGHDEIIFDGGSFVLNFKGEQQAQLPTHQEADQQIILSKKQSHHPITISTGSSYPEKGYPEIKSMFHYQQIKLGLKDYMTRCQFSSVVIGLSGGIDSALTLTLARSVLPKEKVTAITMPSRYSSKGSITDSKAICDNLGVQLITIPIEENFILAKKRFHHAFNEPPSPLTQENMQARIRGQILMEYANHYHALLLATGNKSELAVGYATLYGDMNGGLNLIGDLYKTEVYALAAYLNNQISPAPIPTAILNKEPSAELSAGQKDRDSLPPYPHLDAILRLTLEFKMLSEQEKKHCYKQIDHVSKQTIQKIQKQVDHAEFKRRQAPPVIRMRHRAFGVGWRMPIAHNFPNTSTIYRK
ncbi:NAD+ synthase [Magnetococcales bacterium HHB-1]